MPSPRTISVGDRTVGGDEPTYIIAEIGSNFDGSFERATKLIDLAAECGADAAKFQAFEADKIVSETGFDGLQVGFQAEWDRPVYEVYEDAELPREWIPDLKEHAEQAGVDFLCTPYDRDAVDRLVDVDVPAMKIGSGDITWHSFLKYVAETDLSVILATGASTTAEIDEAVTTLEDAGCDELALLQCITNYPASFETANIRAMQSIQQMWDVPVGYSDHTPGSVVPLGAVSLGGRIIEKHFTDDKTRDGPDHPHSLDIREFGNMVDRIRNLERALGRQRKELYTEDEDTTVVVQRRCLRAARDVEAGAEITRDTIDVLRPAPKEAITPEHEQTLVGREAQRVIEKGECFRWDDV